MTRATPTHYALGMAGMTGATVLFVSIFGVGLQRETLRMPSHQWNSSPSGLTASVAIHAKVSELYPSFLLLFELHLLTLVCRA